MRGEEGILARRRRELKIQLIHPPVFLNVKAMTALKPSLPLGLAYIAASLRAAGHELSLVDALGEAPDQVTPGYRPQISQLGLRPSQIVERLDPQADAFGISNTWSFSWPIVREMIQRIKEAYPNKPIVCGGEHFTGLPEFSMEQAPLDFVVLGEGEEGAVEMFGALGQEGVDYSEIPGIWYRDAAGKPTKSARPRGRVKEVDGIPWPAWDLFDVNAYDERRLTFGYYYGKTIPIMATRGCPYQCTYCSSPQMWTTKWYARNPKDVCDEIEHNVKVHGANNFPFHDLTAILKKDWILSFCEELYSRSFCDQIRWQLPSGTRVEVIDDEVAGWLRKTNGISMTYSPESGSEETRKRVKKRMKEESLIRAVKAAVKNKLTVSACIVLGFPEDTAKDFKQSVRLVRKLAWLGISDVNTGLFFPIPNTALYWQLKKEGRLELNDEFLLTPIFGTETTFKEQNNYNYNMSARELTWWRYWIALNFYVISYTIRPWRLVNTIWNIMIGKETRKIEVYLIDLRRKLKVAWKGLRVRRKMEKDLAATDKVAA